MITEKELQEKELAWEKEKDLLERELKIKQEKEELKAKAKGDKEKMSTTKRIVWWMFINCTLIEMLTVWALYKNFELATIFGYSVDFSPLVALIGAVIGEVMVFATYAVKAKAENTVGGIEYERMLHNLSTIDEDNRDLNDFLNETNEEITTATEDAVG